MSKQTLLIVDDEPNILKSVKRIFIDTDYRVLLAESGEEGLKKLKEGEIDLVISDYRMPGMNGVEFLYEVKEKYPDTIRMILSGYADVMAIVEAINEGQIYKFIAKPWNDHEFMTTVMRALEQYALQKENKALQTDLENRNRQLTELTKNLEEKVTERTRDIEMKNRALTIAHNILNFLPGGVIGIDLEETVVYYNDALQQYIDTSKIGLAVSAKGAIDDKLLDVMMRVVRSGNIIAYKSDNDFELICTPLPGRVGVIGLFCWRDSNNYIKQDFRKKEKLGVAEDG